MKNGIEHLDKLYTCAKHKFCAALHSNVIAVFDWQAAWLTE